MNFTNLQILWAHFAEGNLNVDGLYLTKPHLKQLVKPRPNFFALKYNLVCNHGLGQSHAHSLDISNLIFLSLKSHPCLISSKSDLKGLPSCHPFSLKQFVHSKLIYLENH